ncbi:MAG: hypothetical protein ABSA18_16095 [Dehalococcoidia bacterium]|jgi:hypothetical protein
MEKPSSLPFGLRYEEHPVANDFVSSIYDEDEDISVVIDENGQKIPSVEYRGNLGTKTLTRLQNESTDEDPGTSKLGGTRTITAVQSESTDFDDGQYSLALSTKTTTFVQAEQSDEDPGIDVVSRPPLTTRTATKVAREDTDQDR